VVVPEQPLQTAVPVRADGKIPGTFVSGYSFVVLVVYTTMKKKCYSTFHGRIVFSARGCGLVQQLKADAGRQWKKVCKY